MSQSPFTAPRQDIGVPNIDDLRAARKKNRDEAQKLLDNWRRKAGRHGDLIKIGSLGGLRPSRENAQALMDSIEDESLTPDDKAVLMDLTGDMFRALDELNDPVTKEKVRAHVAKVARTEMEPKLWKSAAFTYSRMGWFPDSKVIFMRGKLIWGDRDYYGELAHAVVTAPKDDQALILRELASGDEVGRGKFTFYAAEILASQLRSEEAAKILSPQAAAAAIAWLKKKEPAFDPVPSRVGLIDMSNYLDWVRALVTLKARVENLPPRNILPSFIDVEGDPRKLASLLSEGSSAALVRSSMDQPTLIKMEAKITAWGEKYKTDPNVQEIVQRARIRLAGN